MRTTDCACASGTRVGLADPGGLCGVAPGETKGTIFLFAVLPDGLQAINYAYLDVPTLIEAQFDSPSGEAEVEFDVAFGGKVAKMTLKRFGPRGYSYRSEVFVPRSTGSSSIPAIDQALGQPPLK